MNALQLSRMLNKYRQNGCNIRGRDGKAQIINNGNGAVVYNHENGIFKAELYTGRNEPTQLFGVYEDVNLELFSKRVADHLELEPIGGDHE